MHTASKRSRAPLPITAALALCGALAPTVAAAQPAPGGENDALRRDLLAQAEAARDAGDHTRALDLATRASQLRASPSLSFMIAQEAAELGHVVDALDAARRCVADASADASLRNRDRVLRGCAALVQEVEPRLARLTVRVPEGVPGVVVEVARRPLPGAVWGVAVPVDPGEVTVAAHTGDGRSFSRTVTTVAGQSAEVAVSFAPAAPAAPPVEVAAPAPTVAPVVAPPPAPAVARAGVGAGPWIVAGLGAAVLGGAGVLWMMHGSALDERDGACSAAGCLPSALDANDRAQTLTLATNVSLAVGGAALVGGVTWFLIARGRSARVDATPHATAWVTPQGAMVGIGGAL